jgi:outer membrane protein, heavy metal efflux system
MREPDDDGFGLELSISLPIWRDRYRAAIRQAGHQFQAANASLVDRRNALEADLQLAMYNLRDANRKIALYRDTLLPRAGEAMRASEAAYRAGTVDFLTLVESYRLPLEFELALVRARTQYAQRLAEIELLIGQSIEQPGNHPQGSIKP